MQMAWARGRSAWAAAREGARRVVRALVLFAIARLILGIALITVFDRGAVAWGTEATLVVLAAAVVYLGVGLAVRRAECHGRGK
ncbi:MAG: hypothetical protein IVW36_00960 [Dehalococcoidia bacterium]|nr:hypothetical protein [Dehalococcoidia bacterium]